MPMRERYTKAMDAIHTACLFIAGVCLVVIILIIPYGVFCRYVLNSAASWPEPMAVLLMIILSFLSAVVCYREYLHIGVGVLPAFLAEPAKPYLGWSADSRRWGFDFAVRHRARHDAKILFRART